jgi:hypothetical protein
MPHKSAPEVETEKPVPRCRNRRWTPGL